MRRRLLLLVALVVAGGLASGCADDVAPAVRIGDAVAVSQDQLLAELDEWAGSPSLLGQLGVTGAEGAGAGSYSTAFVDYLLSNRVSFELHNLQFEELGLKLAEEDLSAIRSGLFADPAATAAVFEELGDEYEEELLADVARQVAVGDAMGEDYPAWQAEAFTRTDIEINPRFGSWDSQVGQVVAPLGPRPAPGSEPLVDPVPGG